MFVLLEDYEVKEFNFSMIWDPDLKPGGGPSETVLYKLVFQSRNDPDEGAYEFADVVRWTLRPATFEALQRVHGPRPIE